VKNRDTSLDWTGKRVALIGNGSSAIQILPKVQPTAKTVMNYIRSPTWVAANFAADFTPEGKNFRYSEQQKQNFREHPEELLKLRKDIEHGYDPHQVKLNMNMHVDTDCDWVACSINQLFLGLIKGTDRQLEANKMSKRIMQDRLNHDPELCAKLIPAFEFGCRRISPGEGYLEALQESNVGCCFDSIKQITENGIQTIDGQIAEYDIIICATGFDVSFSPFWKLVGRNGTDLAERWKNKPDAYFGMCAPEQPNYFIFNGPNCPSMMSPTLSFAGRGFRTNHYSCARLLACSDGFYCRLDFEVVPKDCLRGHQVLSNPCFHPTEVILIALLRSVCVKPDALDDYNVYTQETLKRTVWTGGCRSWFKGGRKNGPVTAMYGGSIIHYKGKGVILSNTVCSGD
jgi:hypothetical protein